ncbi:MAG: hypothetical protein ABIG87_02430 [Patescibacteria group bacterium]
MNKFNLHFGYWIAEVIQAFLLRNFIKISKLKLVMFFSIIKKKGGYRDENKN